MFHYSDVIMSAMASQITGVRSLNRLFMRKSKKTPNLRLTGLCGGNPPVTDGFPSQRASNAEYVSIWWRQHAYYVHPSHTEQFISLRPDHLVVSGDSILTCHFDTAFSELDWIQARAATYCNISPAYLATSYGAACNFFKSIYLWTLSPEAGISSRDM